MTKKRHFRSKSSLHSNGQSANDFIIPRNKHHTRPDLSERVRVCVCVREKVMEKCQLLKKWHLSICIIVYNCDLQTLASPGQSPEIIFSLRLWRFPSTSTILDNDNVKKRCNSQLLATKRDAHIGDGTPKAMAGQPANAPPYTKMMKMFSSCICICVCE